jgi:hypothetical protein
MGVSSGDTACLEHQDRTWTTQPTTGNTMNATMRYAAPWLAAAAIGGDDCSRAHRKRRHESLVPYGTDPHSPYMLAYHVSNHDEANTTNGQVDTPF